MKAINGRKTCSKCRHEKPVNAYHKNRAMPDGLHSQCKECNSEARSAYRKRHPEHSKKWWKENPHYALSRQGVDIDQGKYERLLAEQGGKCAICEYRPAEGERRLCVDHDHNTLAVRGLLCNPCNVALGYMRDDPKRLEAAARYLAR